MTEADGVLVVEVPALLAGVRIDRAVAMLANISRSAATELVVSGRVLVDDVAATIGRNALKEGSVLTIALLEQGGNGVEAEAGVQFRVVYDDAEVAVVDKPAGLVVHPGAGHQEGTLVGGLLARFPDLAELVTTGVCPGDRPGIVHRLDKGTSGLLAVARTESAYRALVGQLADRSMERRYLALVEGEVADDRGEIDAPIGRSTRTPTKMAVSASGRSARTGFTVLERRTSPRPTTSGGTQVCKVGEPTRSVSTWPQSATRSSVTPVTARRRRRSDRDGSSSTPSGLAFNHPGSGERMEFSAPLPDDLKTFLGGLVDAEDVGVEGQGR